MIDKWNDIREIGDTSQVQLNIEFKGFDFILFWGLSVKRSMLKLDALWICFMKSKVAAATLSNDKEYFSMDTWRS